MNLMLLHTKKHGGIELCSIFVYWQQCTLLVEQPQFLRPRCKLISARHLDLQVWFNGEHPSRRSANISAAAWPRVHWSIFSFTGPIYCSFHLARAIFLSSSLTLSLTFSLSPFCCAAGGGRAAWPPPRLHGALLHHAVVPEATFGGVRHFHLLRQLAIQARLGRVTPPSHFHVIQLSVRLTFRKLFIPLQIK